MTVRVLACAAFAAASAAVGLCLGPVDLSLAEVLAGLRGEGKAADIVRDLRLPRIALGLGVGAALAVAGALLQSLFRNDLAEPYLLGVGPGAFLGVVVAALCFGAAGAGTMPEPAVRGAFAFAGGALVTLLVLTFARRQGRDAGASVILAGVAIGTFVAAIGTGLLHAAVPDWADVLRWMLGDLELSDGPDALLMAGVLALGLGAAMWGARDLDALTLGEDAAALGGVTVRRTLWIQGGLACLLASVAVALCGQVGFVGLVVPHLARGLVGATHRMLLPGAAFLGGGLLVLADALARTVHPPAGLPLGVVTAALGAPVLILLLLRRR